MNIKDKMMREARKWRRERFQAGWSESLLDHADELITRLNKIGRVTQRNTYVRKARTTK